MTTINIRTIGTKYWNEIYDVPDNVEIISSDGIEYEKKIFDVVVLERNLSKQEAAIVKKMSRGYCVFFTDSFELDENTKNLIDEKLGKLLPEAEIQNFIFFDSEKYFGYTYGEKLDNKYVSVAKSFPGEITYNGKNDIGLHGSFGDEFTQILFWKNNIPIDEGQSLDLWLEYEKDGSVEILFEVFFIASGGSQIIRTCSFSEEDLQREIVLKNFDVRSFLFLSLKARGAGSLNVYGLHSRHSRQGLGAFWVGGERVVTSKKEEIFSYFEPGDLKPPLAVYFSGFKTQEGFEGYYMLRSMGVPFLLIAEQRLDGGAFYIGDDEYENAMVYLIRRYLDKLGFDESQLILSGISMGTTGSMYYGADIGPHALILGKPLANLGTIAANEKLIRPGGFATSLDMLKKHVGNVSLNGIEQLNNRFWKKFESADWSNTKFIVSHLYEDDYDNKAYDDILLKLNSTGVQVYGKGIHGRHNDNTAVVAEWFKGQYLKVLREDFGRNI